MENILGPANTASDFSNVAISVRSYLSEIQDLVLANKIVSQFTLLSPFDTMSPCRPKSYWNTSNADATHLHLKQPGFGIRASLALTLASVWSTLVKMFLFTLSWTLRL